MGHLFYPRHFILLFCAVVILALTGAWGRPREAVVAFGVYGALHSAIVVASLRVPQALVRRLLFVSLAASLAMLCVLLGFYGTRHLAVLPGMSGPELLVTLSSGLGAATYAVLIRLFWIDDLSPRAIFSLTLGCMSAILAALMCGSSFLRTVGELWFAAVWWLAFSTGLWYQERLAAPSRRAPAKE
ncbi:MAG: hypothetical protein QOD56_2640 [Gammaproteobacteria bacterium]|jgi:hypothetical protein|nr:hypothetical protein [Gammaproteobacteria bacterium]